MSNFINGHRSHSQNGTLDEHINALTVQLSTTRAQRIRAAIFPEAFDDDTSNGYSSSPTQFGHGSAVQKLSEPSQLLKNAVIDIINYKEDADITEKALPELIRLLNDDDPIVAGQAALILHSLAKKEASRSALSTAPMMNALIQAISKPRASDETRRGVAGVLHCLSQNKQGLLILYKSGGIPLLVKLLDSPTDSVVNYALSALHNLLLNVDQSKLEILRCGGCQKMVGLLHSQNAKFLAMLTDCLHILAFNNEEVKIIIESSDGPQQLLSLLDMTDYEKLLWTTTRLLRVLSVSPSIKIVMVSKNAIKLLEKELYEPRSLRIQQNCLQILRNLSDQAVKLVRIILRRHLRSCLVF